MIVFELIIVIITTYIFGRSLSRILNGTSNSISDYVLLALYILNCFPVFLDLVFGIPVYQNYFYKFKIVQLDKRVRLVYDIYILCIVIILGLYSNIFNKKGKEIDNNYSDYKGLKNFFSNKFFIFLPFIHILFSPYLVNYFTIYGTATKRGYHLILES